jgi:hypothetical protein
VKQILIEHGAHLGFVVIGVFAFLWIAYRPERGSDSGSRAERRKELERLALAAADSPAPDSRTPTTVRRSVARRGLLALGPLLGAVATGAVLYGLDVGGGSVPGAVIWIHCGISLLALLLVVYKVGDLGIARIRRAFSRQRLTELVSVVLGILSVPLILTGVPLLFAPSTSSFFSYAHLISAAWWTGLLVWHLRRYVGASLRASFKRESRSAPIPVERPLVAPAVEMRGDRIRWRTSD